MTRKGFFDAVQIRQALINLLKNAAEAGSPGDATTLELRDKGTGGFNVIVSDHDRGMSDEVIRKALLPFYSTKTAGSLGLPLCREIVEAHGGTIRIERREGGGIRVIKA